MTHENLVRVHDLSRLQQTLRLDSIETTLEQGRLFLVMDLIKGQTPRERLATVEEGSRDGVLRGLAHDLALALAHVHTHGLVHHDVKPENVVLDGEHRAVLLDLGLATVHGGGHSTRGTLAFMAPEGIVGGGDHRVDLYSLGATLYCLVAGRPPFEGPRTSRDVELVRRILEQPAALDRPAWLSVEMHSLVLQLLEKNPLDRPSSARTVLAELARMEGDHAAVAALTSRREVLAPAFVGRREELVRLERLLEARSDASVGLLAGDVGAGKTRLLREALRHHRIGAAAGRHTRTETVVGDFAAVSAALGVEGSDADESVLRVVERLEGRETPLCIVLEGLDEDPLARRLLEAVIVDWTLSKVVLLAEVYPGSPTLAELGGHPRVLSLELAPLSLDETRRLVASMLGLRDPPEAADTIHRLSEGNPALAVELTRLENELGEEGLDLDLVGGLHDVAARRRAGLAPAQRRVMDALAVWEDAATSGELAALTGLDPGEAWAAVEELAGTGTLPAPTDRVSPPGKARRAAWAGALESSEARALHRRAADLLGERPGPRLAWHLIEAGDPEAPQAALDAARELMDAGDQTAAIPLLERIIEGPLRVQAVPLLARVLAGTGGYDLALELLEEDTSERAQLLRAEVLQKRGDYEEAATTLQRLIPDIEQSGERENAVALLARLRLGQGRPADALAVVQPHLGSRPSSPALLEMTGLAHFYLGDLERADRLFSDGAAAESAPARLARFDCHRGNVALSAGRNAEAAAHYATALERASSAGDVHGRATYLANLGAVQLQLGQLGQALVHFTRAVRDLGRLARTTEHASALVNLANLLTRLGDLESAAGTLDQAREQAGRLSSRHTAGFVASLEADHLRRRGDLQGAVEGYREALAIFEEVGAARERVDCQLALCAALVESRERSGAARLLRGLWQQETDRRGEVAAAWLRLGRTGGLPPAAPPADRLEREVAEHCARLEEQGARFDLWRAATVLGGWLVSGGREAAARGVLGRAKKSWEEILNDTPEVYHERMGEDPDARSLAADWQSLLEAPEGPAASQGAISSVLYDRRWVKRVLAINKRLNSEQRLPFLLELIMDTAIELTEAERGFLLLLGDDGSLSVKVARNIDQKSLEGEELSLSRSIAEKAALGAEPVVAIDAAEDNRFREALSVSDLRLRSVLAVPLLLKGRGVGTIYVDHRLRQGVFGGEEVSLMQDIAEQAAIAIENARLLAENRRKAEEIERLNQQLVRKVDSQSEELAQAREELRSSRQALKLRYDYGNIIGRTPKMLELFQLLDRVTETDLPVVVQGESGTGKELVARAIHHNGRRSGEPFVGENCGAIPETLLESVLFGHVKGAFTGAERDRKGLFEVASGGTLFLDEVGEMSPAMQTKLLRVLQDGELRRVGGTQTIATDVRIIAASNRDLSQLVAEGRFREDLYYRLNVIQIQIPPLRERREDIPLLVEHLLGKHSRGEHRVSPEALGSLMGYLWPGNVRELENEIMRAAALGGEVIGVRDLSPQIAASVPLALHDPDDLDLRTRVEHLERELIHRALKRTGGNNTRAARLLGLSRYGLLKKIQRYALTREAERQQK
jgi:transcriptional regulator with GAF, ATPase, and Fis domain/Tfp pilus assembly protein PilF